MSKEKTETAEQAQETQTAAAAKPEKVVYCGPTVRGVAVQYTAFIGGLPQRVQDFVEKYPAAQALIVPYAEFAQTRVRIASGKGAECMIIRNLQKQIKEG